MNLDNLDTVTASEQGVKMELRHPSTDEVLRKDDGSPITITILGRDSKAYKHADRQATDRRLARQAERGGRVPLTQAGIEQDDLNRLVATTVGWDGIRWDDQEQPFSQAAAREMYIKWPWTREQAVSFQEQRANFLKMQSVS